MPLDDFMAAFDKFNQGLRDVSSFNAINEANETVKTIKGAQMKDFEQRQAIQGVANDLATRLGSFGVDPRQAAQVKENMTPAPPPMAQSAEQVLLNPGQYGDDTVGLAKQQDARSAALNKRKLDIMEQKVTQAGAPKALKPMEMDKLRQNLKTDLDADRQRTGNMGTISAKVYAAQRLKAVALDEKGQLQNINPNQMQEVSTALATLVSGSNTVGEHQINALVPKTAQGDIAKMMEWWSGEPQGANQKEFLKLFVKTADREEKLANTQLQGIMTKRLSSHSLLRQHDPEGYKQIVSGYMTNPFEAIDAAKQQQQQSAAPKDAAPNTAKYWR